jgi:hypothetical protein
MIDTQGLNGLAQSGKQLEQFKTALYPQYRWEVLTKSQNRLIIKKTWFIVVPIFSVSSSCFSSSNDLRLL